MLRRSLACNVCGKDFAHHSSLSRHRKLHQNLSLPCDACGNCYKTPSALATHQRRAHKPGAKGSACPTCFTECGDAKSLAFHTSLHLPPDQRPDVVSPHLCGTCFRAYTRAEYLKKHKAKCHAASLDAAPADAADQAQGAIDRYRAFLAEFENLVKWPEPVPAPGLIRRGTAESLSTATLETASLFLELRDGLPFWTYGVHRGDRLVPLRDVDWRRIHPAHDPARGNRGDNGDPLFSTAYFRRVTWSRLFERFRRTECTPRQCPPNGGGIICCSICRLFHVLVPPLPGAVQAAVHARSPSTHGSPSASRDLPDLRDCISPGARLEASPELAQRLARVFDV